MAARTRSLPVYAKLVAKGKLDQTEVDRRMAAITAGLKEDLLR